jgi:hypothetical protein
MSLKEYLQESSDNRQIVKTGRSIDGFVWTDKKGECWYAFGKPSAYSYIAFPCKTIEDGINKIKEMSKQAKEVFK